MPTVIQKQPRNKATEKTLLLKLSHSSSSASMQSTGSLSELNVLASANALRINRYNQRICCNFSRTYQIFDARNELLLKAEQENGCCSSDYEEIFVYDSQDQLIFSLEFEETSGYLSKQMKFSVISSAKVELGSVLWICSFMESPRYEIRNWDDRHLFCIGPPKTSGIKSYDFKKKYEVTSNDGRVVANLVQERKMVSLDLNITDPLQCRDKVLILALGFILDLLRDEESN